MSILRGEWWIQDDGHAVYADGEVSDDNHQGLALWAALEIDPQETGYGDAKGINIFPMEKFDTETLKWLAEHGANKDAVEYLKDGSDPRDYAMEKMGWIRVQDNRFQMWNFGDDELRLIKNFDEWNNVEDPESLDDSSETITIEQMKDGKMFTVSLKELFAAKSAKGLMNYKDGIGKWRNPPEITDPPSKEPFFFRAGNVDGIPPDMPFYYVPDFPIRTIGDPAGLIRNFDNENKRGEYQYLLTDGYVQDTRVAPIIVFDSGNMIDGWHRSGAAAKVGLTTVAAWVAKDSTENPPMKNPQKKVKWAYHDTDSGNLRSIGLRGLVPASPESEQRATLYFVDSLAEARERLLNGEVILRFPWPKDATSTGDAWDTEFTIMPSDIEMMMSDGSWSGLKLNNPPDGMEVTIVRGRQAIGKMTARIGMVDHAKSWRIIKVNPTSVDVESFDGGSYHEQLREFFITESAAKKFGWKKSNPPKSLSPGDPFPATGYRGGGEMIFKRGSVRDILDYEGDELGNEDIRDGALKGVDWSKVPASKVVWVTLKKKDALQYTSEDQDEGLIDTVKLPSGSFVVASDYDTGYLVHIGPLKGNNPVKKKKKFTILFTHDFEGTGDDGEDYTWDKGEEIFVSDVEKQKAPFGDMSILVLLGGTRVPIMTEGFELVDDNPPPVSSRKKDMTCDNCRGSCSSVVKDSTLLTTDTGYSKDDRPFNWGTDCECARRRKAARREANPAGDAITDAVHALKFIDDHHTQPDEDGPAIIDLSSLGIDEDPQSFTCTNTAAILVKMLKNHGAEIYGFAAWDNPTASIGEDVDGHDFAVLPDGTIIDWWRLGHTMRQKDIAVIRPGMKEYKEYGDRKKWEKFKYWDHADWKWTKKIPTIDKIAG